MKPSAAIASNYDRLLKNGFVDERVGRDRWSWVANAIVSIVGREAWSTSDQGCHRNMDEIGKADPGYTGVVWKGWEIMIDDNQKAYYTGL